MSTVRVFLIDRRGSYFFSRRSAVEIWNGYTYTKQIDKKRLEIPKGLSEAVNRTRRDNTMAKRKRTKGQTTI
jgi:hypothetical protein